MCHERAHMRHEVSRTRDIAVRGHAGATTVPKIALEDLARVERLGKAVAQHPACASSCKLQLVLHMQSRVSSLLAMRQGPTRTSGSKALLDTGPANSLLLRELHPAGGDTLSYRLRPHPPSAGETHMQVRWMPSVASPRGRSFCFKID